MIVTSEKHSFRTSYTSFFAYISQDATFYGPPALTKETLRLGKKDIPPLAKKIALFGSSKANGGFHEKQEKPVFAVHIRVCLVTRQARLHLPERRSVVIM